MDHIKHAEWGAFYCIELMKVGMVFGGGEKSNIWVIHKSYDWTKLGFLKFFQTDSKSAKGRHTKLHLMPLYLMPISCQRSLSMA